MSYLYIFLYIINLIDSCRNIDNKNIIIITKPLRRINYIVFYKIRVKINYRVYGKSPLKRISPIIVFMVFRR
jgi:hypothetical protein